MERSFPGGQVLRLMVGDITRVPADAIVNAANSALAGGGGVDGAIHRTGGPAIMHELKTLRAKWGGCPTGSAVVTGAGKLPARWVFHAVGPVYRDGKQGEAELLASCYRTCLALAAKHGAGSLSFPSISTGAYGYPVAEAAEIAIREVALHLDDNSGAPREVTFVLFNDDVYRAYASCLSKIGGTE